MDATTFDRFRRAYWRVARLLDTVRLRQWERSQLTLPQLRVLFQVRRLPGITTGELSRTLGITVSTTSGLVIKLADRGLIVRERTAEDRRQASLYLSDAAASLVGELSDVGRPFLREVAELLGDDLAEVAEALERLAASGEGVRAAEPEDTALDGSRSGTTPPHLGPLPPGERAGLANAERRAHR